MDWYKLGKNMRIAWDLLTIFYLLGFIVGSGIYFMMNDSIWTRLTGAMAIIFIVYLSYFIVKNNQKESSK